ncbi:ion transporter [Flavobacterium gilvum]|uniref:Ion transporter n=1 Tax=Flavobacterium gilvum TaxID=1492737 RepID=A0AAC9N631_9FLAO|nr:ion transporter [Flavobacterium gilvum]AOW10676.1 ion transporter [Flavobacterium gilvum]
MRKPKTKFNLLRQKIHIIIYGSDTRAGRLFDLILLGLILLSIILVMLETVKEFDAKYHHILVIFEWIITILFSIEYLLRTFTTNTPRRYIFSFLGIIDLIAILPMYLSLFSAGTKVLLMIRALRLLRLFKILNHPQFMGQSQQLVRALNSSRRKIAIFLYFIIISVILIGSLMYVVEGEKNGFTSIPISIYWAIVTLTTVGYGDISPATPLGQFIASIVMILGYGVIAVPTGIVTAEFAKANSNQNKTDEVNPTKPEENNCGNCGAENHYKNAHFCYNCGYPFSSG